MSLGATISTRYLRPVCARAALERRKRIAARTRIGGAIACHAAGCRIARMKILVSNDDGYFAPGVTLLAEALGRLGGGTVFAPERDRPGASDSLTPDRPAPGPRAPSGVFSVTDRPTACV